MGIKIPKEVADAAAAWWAKALEHPKFDNGDPSPTGGITMAMATLAAKAIPADKLERFREELSKAIQAQECPSWHASPEHWRVTLHVDYGPDLMLYNAAAAAGIERPGIASFPWKTCMWVRPIEVTVSHGYGAEPQIIWTPKAVAPKPPAFREEECGGVFDGTRVVSDADPGL